MVTIQQCINKKPIAHSYANISKNIGTISKIWIVDIEIVTGSAKVLSAHPILWLGRYVRNSLCGQATGIQI